MPSNRSRVVLYIGVTDSLERRLWFHGSVERDSFVQRYNLDRLVYYESYHRPDDAIAREKQRKRWRREKKNALIERLNSKWRDLGQDLFRTASARSLDTLRGSGRPECARRRYDTNGLVLASPINRRHPRKTPNRPSRACRGISHSQR